MVMYRWADDAQASVIRESDGANIPADPGNRDYADFLRWQDAGGGAADPVGPTLDAAKGDYRHRVDDDAERCRLRFITPGAGMAMTYQEKFAQAQAVDSMGAETANALSIAEREAQFPTLSASVGIEGATLYECAELVLQKYAEFAALSLVIERTRLSAKAAIAAASDVAGVRTAYEAVAWPTP